MLASLYGMNVLLLIKKADKAVDRTLQDLRNTNLRMGGITFLFSDDFQQTLPVVVRGTRTD